VAPRLVDLTIEAIGAAGDGVAHLDGRAVYVPFTVAGDRVSARIEGRRGDGLAAALVEVLSPGPGRVAPRCPHYGRCGGCTLQHLADAGHDAWKMSALITHLARHRLGSEAVEPLVRGAAAARRRVQFALIRTGRGVAIGFHARASHAVIDVEACPLLAPPLAALLPRVRDLLGGRLPEGARGEATATLTEGGIDLLIEAPLTPDLALREALAAFAEGADLARLHWRTAGEPFAEPIARRRPAVVRFGAVPVEPPPGGFLQATEAGEHAIAARVLAALGDEGGPAADLYAGCGCFALRIAARRPVHAVEGERAPLAALDAAARAHGLAVTTEARDLARRPLLAPDLARVQALVLDPPRAGAAAQVEVLAGLGGAAGPHRLAMVSCNPATLARDLRTLVDGGWTIDRIMPIDQFLWSAHLEVVVALRR